MTVRAKPARNLAATCRRRHRACACSREPRVGKAAGMRLSASEREYRQEATRTLARPLLPLLAGGMNSIQSVPGT
jgi:hypothetical protein